MAAQMVIISMGILYLCGGLEWLRHFLFPVFFMLVAIPWPSFVEHALAFTLGGVNARVAAEVVSLAGIPAVAVGNVIRIGSGYVGVDEACSGIRSLQASLMVGLFLGELYRLAAPRRAWLCLLALIAALAANAARIVFLVWVAHREGLAAVGWHHDAAGLRILLVTFLLSWGVALCWRSREPGETELADTPASAANPIPRWVSISLCAALTAVIVVPSLWFAYRQGQSTPLRWTLAAPIPAGVESFELPPEIRGQLRFQQGQSLRWQGAANTVWQLHFMQWPDAHNLFQRAEVLSALNHRPDQCLTATGKALVQDLAVRTIRVSGVEIPFRMYQFNDRGAPLWVFFFSWEGGAQAGALANHRAGWSERLQAAWAGHRATGLRVLEVGAWGLRDAAEAEASLARELERLIVRTTAG